MLGSASCLYLMFYLPPASWWRFVGWLTLGMAVYFAYGYHHSVVGAEDDRAGRHGGALKIAALGMVASTVGLFVIPHDASPVRLIQLLGDAAQASHGRALWGVTAIGLGLAVTVASLWSVKARPKAA